VIDTGIVLNILDKSLHSDNYYVLHIPKCTCTYTNTSTNREPCGDSHGFNDLSVSLILHLVTSSALSGDCGIPDAPVNGNVSLSSTTVGHTVNYTCEQGYKLLGTSSRTCQDNGQWSGTQPSCSRKL